LILSAALAVGTSPRADEPAGSGPEEQLSALRKEFDGAKQDAQREAVAARVLELARNGLKGPAAVDALTWVVERGPAPLVDQALDALRRDHVDSNRLGASCSAATGTGPAGSLAAERLLREATSRSPHRRIRGRAHFQLAEVLEDRADDLRRLAQHPEWLVRRKEQFGADGWARYSRRGADELIQEAEGLYETIIADYADLDTSRKVPLGEVSEGRLFRLRNLRVGRPAPEIEGEDVDGRRFRLSDDRGKVVLLTFSGNWCGACRGFYPQERRLVARFKGRPFAARSVNTDEDVETLRQSIDSGEITWRCWRDGGTSGPITLRWGVSYFPTVFVLDHKGVIRAEQVGPEELDATLNALVKEAEAAAPPGP